MARDPGRLPHGRWLPPYRSPCSRWRCGDGEFPTPSIPRGFRNPLAADPAGYLLEGKSIFNNFGSSDKLLIRTLTNGDSKQAAFQFDLSPIPARSQVLSATAYFFVTAQSAQPVTLHRVTTPWAENTATWATLATAYDHSVAGAMYPTTKNQLAGADVTALVQAWVTGSAPNYGMMLLGGSDDVEVQLASKEQNNAAQHPYLQVVIATESITLDVQKDTGIWQSLATNNYGACGLYTLDTSGGDIGNGRPLLQFDLGSIPNQVAIVSAQLQLVKVSGATTAHDIQLFPLTTAWDEGSGGCFGAAQPASWTERQSGTPWTQAGGDYDSTSVAETTVSANALYTWDITGLARQWQTGARPNHGVILGTPDTGTDLFIFASREYIDPTLRPRLVVSYAATTTTIAGRVWDDANRNSLQDNGENGLSQVSLELYPGACGAAPSAPSQRTLTGTDGHYWFTDLSDGDYCVRVDENSLPPLYSNADDRNPRDLSLNLATIPAILNADFAYAGDQAPDRLVVGTYAPCTDYGWLQTLAAGYGASIITADTSACDFTLSVPAANQDGLAAAIAAAPSSRHGHPDLTGAGQFIPNDPDFSNPSLVYGPQQVNAPAAWELTLGDPNLILAVVDTGVDMAHPEFAGRIAPGYDFANDDNDPSDDHGHGTHVAGIAAAAIDNALGMAGMAGRVQIMPIKVLNANNIGWMSDVAAGVTYAVDHGARVINLSLAGASESLAMRDAIAYAVSKNVVVVAAAGNDNSDVPRYPAIYDNVIAVGATTYTHERWTLSNYGPNLDVLAPGSTIWSARPGNSYAFMSGTSMAAPHGAGLAALLLSVNPNLTPDQVKTAMQETATDMGPTGVDTLYGYGQINAAAALTSVPAAPMEPPVTGLTVALAKDVNGNGLVDVGDTVRYRVVAANGNPAPLAGVVVSGTIPTHTTYVLGSVTLNGIPVLDDADVNAPFPLEGGGLAIGSIPPHNSSVVAFDVQVGNLPRGVYRLFARAEVTTDSGSDVLTTETEVAGTLLKAQASAVEARPGDNLTYSLITDFVGNGLLQNVVITAPIPAGTSYAPGSANAGGLLTGNQILWNLSNNSAPVPVSVAALPNPVALDTVSTRKASSVLSLNISHTTAGQNRLMLVGLSIVLPGPSIQASSVTYAGIPLKREGFDEIAPGSNGARAEIWSLVNPPTGTANVVITFDAVATGVVAGVATFTGVNPASPLGSFYATTTTGTAVSLAVPSAPGDLIFDLIAYNRRGDVYAPDSSQTPIWKSRQTDAAAGASTKPGAGTVTMKWTGDSARNWVLGALSIKPLPPTTLGGRLLAAPTLVTGGDLITVTQALTASQDLNAGPGRMVITGTNRVSAALVSGPTPSSAPVGAGGTAFTWVYRSLAEDTVGQLIFSVDADDGGSNTWPWAQTNSVIVHPPLTFQVMVDDPATTADVQATAFIGDGGDQLPSHASNTTQTQLPASLSGRIWNDRDGDMVQDGGEAGIAAVAVLLSDSQGNSSSQVSDGNGAYTFANLAAGVYTVTVDPATVPAVYEFLTTRNPLQITLDHGEISAAGAFGFKARTGSIGDTIYYDADGDGVQDPSEPGLGNITLELYLDDGDGLFEPVPALGSDTYVGNTVSNAAGAYRLDAPVDGGYFVDVTDDRGLLAGLAHTVGSQSATDPSPAIPVAAGQFVQSVDFGYVRLPAEGQAILGDQVWVDENGDGVRQLAEPVVIDTQICAQPNLGGAPTCTQTDVNGRYLLELPVGGYSVAPTDAPLGLVVTTASPLAVVLTEGTQYLGADFGFGPDTTALGTIGGQIWQDLPVNEVVDGVYNPATEPGLPNVSVDLILDLNQDGLWDIGDVYVAALSDMSGEFRFKGLLADAYLVRVSDTLNVLRRYGPTVAPTTGSAPVDNANKPQPYAIDLAAGQTNTLADFGYREYDVFGAGSTLQPGIIGDQVWFDANNDGRFEAAAGDQPLAGVTVEARSAGVVMATATTGGDGKYLLMDLPLGSTYQVVVTDLFGVLANYQPTAPGVGGQNNQNQAQPYTTLLALSSTDFKADFGFANLATVGDRVWWDQNGNGVQEGGEPGIPDVSLTLSDSSGAPLQSTATNAAGLYSFSNLPVGAYTVTVSAAEVQAGGTLHGWTASPQDAGAPNDDAVDSDGDPLTHRTPLSVSWGENRSNVDLGFTITPTFTLDHSFSYPTIRSTEAVTAWVRITNTGGAWLTHLPLRYDYDPTYLRPLSASPAPADLADDGCLEWADVVASTYGTGRSPLAGSELAPGASITMVLRFAGVADSTLLPNSQALNLAAISGAMADPDGSAGPLGTIPVGGQSAPSGGITILNPTAALLAQSAVEPVAEGAQLTWTTVNESDLVGFHLLRRVDHGQYVRLTAGMIPAAMGGQAAGAAYAFTDVDVSEGRLLQYDLELIDANGGRVQMALGQLQRVTSIYFPFFSHGSPAAQPTK